MRPHEQVDVWRKSVDLTAEIYSVTENFPKDERFGLTSQIRRASVSIAANLAEGAGRRSNKEFLDCLSTSQGSVSEVDTEILIASRLGYLRADGSNTVLGRLDEIGRMITGLCKHSRSKDLT
jgi:four helix bundle protein